jgi:hypothetical protein
VERVVRSASEVAKCVTFEAIEADIGTIKTYYRPADETKSPFRMLEKALIKGPSRLHPDCSQILDVFGCIIECQTQVFCVFIFFLGWKQRYCG